MKLKLQAKRLKNVYLAGHTNSRLDCLISGKSCTCLSNNLGEILVYQHVFSRYETLGMFSSKMVAHTSTQDNTCKQTLLLARWQYA